MSSSAERFDERARREFAEHGRTVVRRGELLRHPVYTRVLHWTVAISFVLSLLSGFAVYSPWLFRWLTPLFGGGPTARFLHPWFGLAFDVAFFFQFINWLAPMAWTGADRRWTRRIKEYVTNREKLEPEDVGFFNAGQKLYFWAIVVSALLFLVTGLLMWFDNVVPRWLVALSYVVHDIAALVMLAGFIIHIYEGTAAQPGTFRAMTNGTVTKEWAWTHHPAWYADATGRDPREDYERERRRLAERERAVEAWEREQDARERGSAGRSPGTPAP
jgi:formate dehydrogenase subunit gamma